MHEGQVHDIPLINIHEGHVHDTQLINIHEGHVCDIPLINIHEGYVICRGMPYAPIIPEVIPQGRQPSSLIFMSLLYKAS